MVKVVHRSGNYSGNVITHNDEGLAKASPSFFLSRMISMRNISFILLGLVLMALGLQLPAVSAVSQDCRKHMDWNSNDPSLQSVQKDLLCQDYFIESTPNSLVSYEYLEQLLSTANPSFEPADAFLLHSNPTAEAIIYLDFDGHTWQANSWWLGAYGIGEGETSAGYTLDNNALTFSEIERNAIYEIWANVAEEFSMYEVDVTTERPTGAREVIFQSRGSHALILSEASVQEGCGCGGVAYVDVFANGSTWNYPALNFSKFGSYFAPPADTAEIISHEVGHNLGLAHDGTTTGIEYYGGHAMWTPIMGAGRGRGIATWSYGGYPDADTRWNQISGDDDYAQLDYYLDFYPDDHGNSLGAATVIGDASLDSLIPGVISTQSDVDVYRFEVTADTEGLWEIELAPAGIAPNLDPELKVFDESGTQIAIANPLVPIPTNYYANLTEGLDAFIELELLQGTYYVSIDGVGQGSLSLGTGYDDYASRGTYGLRLAPPASGVFFRNVSPTSAGAGKVVKLSGSNLSGVLGLRIGTIDIPNFRYVSETEIVFGVPENVVSAPLIATTNAGDVVVLENFTVLNQSEPPTITLVSSQSGVLNQVITITGNNVGAATTLTLAGQSIPFVVTGVDTLQFQISATMSSGQLSIFSAGGSDTARGTFIVLTPMSITSLSVQNVSIGGSLTIFGTNFTKDASITFTGGVKASRPRISGTRITLTVPQGAQSGPITLTNSISSIVSADSLTIVAPPPTISRFSPTTSRVGSVVTITGSNFVQVQSVKIGSLVTSFTVVSSSTIRFTVPVGALTATISVTTLSGTVTSRTQLKVR